MLDTFDRADAAALGTASNGGTWTAGLSGPGGFAPNAPNIVSNKAQAVGSYESAFHSQSIGPDCYVGFELSAVSVIAVPFLLVTNAGSTSKTGYEFDWIPSTGNWEIYRTASGVDTLIASGNVTFPAAGSLVRMYLRGSTVGAEYSTDAGATWTAVGSVTDNTHRGASTKAGIVLGTGDSIDNFFAGTSLPLGRRASGAVVRGSDAEASGAATLSAGHKTSGTVARGTTVEGSGSATLGVGHKTGSASLRGIAASGTGTATLGVGHRDGAAVLYGIGPTSSLILSVGRKTSGAVVRGSSPTATGTATLGVGGKGSAAVIRGTSATPSGAATLLLGRLVGSPTLRGVTVDDVPLLVIVSLALASTSQTNLSLTATRRHELNLEAEIQ